ncbi:hypothetical protein T4B_176 [Trichinella pseudospiralis]|uniref:Uncharacterized protein n=1 Tax=Trichinella pseudospiralis TaxID=6337 RepID=A0A0V1G9N6_TRIPS|nr:hypothetical protein T4B_176 [Trichinella pseudospiralis]
MCNEKFKSNLFQNYCIKSPNLKKKFFGHFSQNKQVYCSENLKISRKS